MDSYEIVVRIALIDARGTKCPADRGIKPAFFSGFFSITTPKGGGEKKKVFCQICAFFHGALADIRRLYSVNFSMLKTFLVAHSFS